MEFLKKILYINNILIIMIEEDYSKWLEAKNKIEYFEELDETLKKEIYVVEQEYADVEINLVEIYKYHSNNDDVDYYEFLFERAYEKDIQRIKEEFTFSEELTDDELLEMEGSQDTIIQVISEAMSLRPKDKVSLVL